MAGAVATGAAASGLAKGGVIVGVIVAMAVRVECGVAVGDGVSVALSVCLDAPLECCVGPDACTLPGVAMYAEPSQAPKNAIITNKAAASHRRNSVSALLFKKPIRLRPSNIFPLSANQTNVFTSI
jgi:hypothetical protein